MLYPPPLDRSLVVEAGFVKLVDHFSEMKISLAHIARVLGILQFAAAYRAGLCKDASTLHGPKATQLHALKGSPVGYARARPLVWADRATNDGEKERPGGGHRPTELGAVGRGRP